MHIYLCVEMSITMPPHFTGGNSHPLTCMGHKWHLEHHLLLGEHAGTNRMAGGRVDRELEGFYVTGEICI
jgi:hypothetical protein